MEDDDSSREPEVRLVKIKPRARLWVVFAALGLVVFIFLGIYILKNSSFGNIVSRALDRTFGGGREDLVEVIDLNEPSASGENTTDEGYKEVVISEDEGSSAPQSIDQVSLTGLEIISVVFDSSGSDEGMERITLKNMSGRPVSLGGGSIQYLPTNGDFSKIVKKNFTDGLGIEAGALFTVGANCSATNPCVGVDMSWSAALGNSGGSIFIVSGRDEITGASDVSVAYRYDYSAN